jgi:thiamine-monophosphate kinase
MVELGRVLADGRLASAAIDLSDGLARDLHRLCRASNTGAIVERKLLPKDSALFELPKDVPLAPLTAALFGGEDFGLLFTVPKRRLAAVERLAGRFALRRIGVVTRSREVLLASEGGTSPLPDEGFDHFAVSSPRR